MKRRRVRRPHDRRRRQLGEGAPPGGFRLSRAHGCHAREKGRSAFGSTARALVQGNGDLCPVSVGTASSASSSTTLFPTTASSTSASSPPGRVTGSESCHGAARKHADRSPFVSVTGSLDRRALRCALSLRMDGACAPRRNVCGLRSSRWPSTSACPMRPHDEHRSAVPETGRLTGDDAWKVLARTGRRTLLLTSAAPVLRRVQPCSLARVHGRAHAIRGDRGRGDRHRVRWQRHHAT